MTRRAPDIDIIEEPGILVEQTIRLRLDNALRRVGTCAARELTFHYEDGYAIAVIDRVTGHQAVCFEL